MKPKLPPAISPDPARFRALLNRCFEREHELLDTVADLLDSTDRVTRRPWAVDGESAVAAHHVAHRLLAARGLFEAAIDDVAAKYRIRESRYGKSFTLLVVTVAHTCRDAD